MECQQRDGWRESRSPEVQREESFLGRKSSGGTTKDLPSGKAASPRKTQESFLGRKSSGGTTKDLPSGKAASPRKTLFSGVGCSNDFHPENKPCFLGRDGQNSQHQKKYFLENESSWRTTKGNRGFSQFFCADRTHLFWVGRVFPRTTTSLVSAGALHCRREA